MNKKLSIFAIVLVLIGIVGTIYSGISSVPYFIDTAKEIRNEVEKEEVIYNKKIDINKLTINAENTNLIIRKSTDGNLKIVKKGLNKNSRYSIDATSKEFIINEENINTENNYNDYSFKDIKDIKSLAKIFMENNYSYYNKSMIIYVPNKVDLDVSTKYTTLVVEDDIFLNNIDFKTINGYISLPRKVKEVEKLNIVSKGIIPLSMSEILGIKEVNIVAYQAKISSSDDDMFIDNIEAYIPNKVNITLPEDNNHIDINTDIPVAREFNIEGFNSNVNLHIPINKFKFNFDMKASSIDINDVLENTNLYNGNIPESNETKEIKGILNKNLESLEKEYKVNIKARNISLD